MRSFFVVSVALLALTAAAAPLLSEDEFTELDKYVRKPDSVFGWKSLHPAYNSTPAYELHFFNLTSQFWLTPADSSRPIWHHTMVLVKPTNMNASCTDAFIWMTWGHNGKKWKPNMEDDLDMLVVTQMAVNTGCPAVALYDIPNQEICFPPDPKANPNGPYCDSEDSIIAYTFHKYLYENKPAEWLMLFPMAKGGIRAMDASEAIISERWGVNITHWVVSGASKRGWTTWLVGAVDPKPGRVKGIVPLVLDAINFRSFIHRQWQSYNGFTLVLGTYWRWGLTRAVDMPIMQNWSTEIDPFWYRKRLTMPKLSINAVGDEFQLLDDQAHWAHNMTGEMHTLLVRNADHILITNFALVLEAMTSYYRSLRFNRPRPSYKWAIDPATGQITVKTSVPPVSVDLIYTWIPSGRRDFRDIVLHEDPCVVHLMGGCVRFLLWGSAKANRTGTNTYSTQVSVPSSGYVGFYLQIKFAPMEGGGDDFVFASPASVLPLGYPFPPCYGTGCNGTLV